MQSIENTINKSTVNTKIFARL